MKHLLRCAALAAPLLAPLCAHAQVVGAIDDSPSTTSLGTTDTVLQAGRYRVYLALQNTGTTDIWCRFGAAASAVSPSLHLVAGAGWTWEGAFVPSGDLHCLSVGSAGALTVWSH